MTIEFPYSSLSQKLSITPILVDLGTHCGTAKELSSDFTLLFLILTTSILYINLLQEGKGKKRYAETKREEEKNEYYN